METGDLSKPSPRTICVLLLAPQQVLAEPRRHKTKELHPCAKQAWSGRVGGADWDCKETCLFQLLNSFPPNVFVLIIIAWLLQLRQKGNSIWTRFEMLFTDNWGNPSLVNYRSVLNGCLKAGTFRDSPERSGGFLTTHLLSKYNSTGPQVSHRWYIHVPLSVDANGQTDSSTSAGRLLVIHPVSLCYLLFVFCTCNFVTGW